MRLRFGAMSIGAVLLGSLATTQATTVRRMDLGDLAKSSALIIQGTVILNEVLSDEGANGPKNVRTVTTIAVGQTLKGRHAETIEVIGLGGEVDGLRFNWPGVPRFEQGDEAILFLQRTPAAGTLLPGLLAGDLTVVGMDQGRLSIIEDEAKGKVVKQSLGEMKIVGDANAIQGPINKGLEDMIREIVEVIETQRNNDE